MKRTIEFGKHAYHSTRKINLFEVKIELMESEKGMVFTASGSIWNMHKTDIICGGQCLDTMLPYLKNNKLFVEIHRLWTKYHLNDMNAGTPEQTEVINKWRNERGYYDYSEACEYLKSIGLYEVIHDGKPYKYGHGWLYREIPSKDLERIKEIIQGLYEVNHVGNTL